MHKITQIPSYKRTPRSSYRMLTLTTVEKCFYDMLAAVEAEDKAQARRYLHTLTTGGRVKPEESARLAHLLFGDVLPCH